MTAKKVPKHTKQTPFSPLCCWEVTLYERISFGPKRYSELLITIDLVFLVS